MTFTVSIHGTIEVRGANLARPIAVTGDIINATSVLPASNVRLWG